MRRRVLVPLLILAAVVVLVLVARAAAAPLLRPALGFAAKVTCSGVLVGGATVEQVRVGFPDERLRQVVRVSADAGRSRVDASVPLLGHRRAVHREGLGCTLVPVGGMIVDMPAPAPAAVVMALDAALPWPEGGAAVPPPAAIDGARLAAVVDSAFLEPGGPSRRTLALVVVHGGRIIAERYADGYSAAHRFPGWSMAKSVTSALAGILAGDGVLDLQATSLRPEWQGADDPRSRITLGHLMHMSSGLAFDESYAPTGAATRMLFDSPDVAAAAAAAPLAHEPGTHWSYSSATTNIIAAYIRAQFGADAQAYASFPATRLFEPTGMRSAVLEPDASGTFVGSSFMHATARDWARFGLLYLRDGEWNGVRILPEGWVAYSTAAAPAAPRGNYGAQWWLNAGSATDTTARPWPDLPRDIYFASGYQGQYVVVLPSHDMVVVRLGLNEEGAWRLGSFLRSLLAAVPPARAGTADPAAPEPAT